MAILHQQGVNGYEYRHIMLILFSSSCAGLVICHLRFHYEPSRYLARFGQLLRLTPVLPYSFHCVQINVLYVGLDSSVSFVNVYTVCQR